MKMPKIPHLFFLPTFRFFVPRRMRMHYIILDWASIAVAAVPTFGFTAAAGMSGAVSFATAGVICQQNADGRYAELIAYNESVTREFDLKVCDQI